MDDAMNGLPTPPADGSIADFPNFQEMYKLVISEAHFMQDQKLKLDNLYLSIVTLLFTADAYEIATARYTALAPIFATTAIAFIGFVVIGNWNHGAVDLARLIENRFDWLRTAEKKRPDMIDQKFGIFSQEYERFYQAQFERARNANLTRYQARVLSIQAISRVVYVGVPVVMGAVTYLNLNPTILHAIQRALP